MTDLERRAMLGDRQAQEECTRQGIVLACPCCKNKSELLVEESAFDGEAPRAFHYIRCKSCFLKSGLYTSVIAVLNKWNTRPAPPVGRCWECEWWDKNTNECWCAADVAKAYHKYTEPDYFCGDFAPKEGEENG